MSSIHFFFEDISETIPTPAKIKAWIRQIIELDGYNLEEINYIFCSDPYLRSINQEYLNHDYLTDIITFNHSENNKELEADIFISWDRVEENAGERDIPFYTELKRVMVHGVLHLIGYNDHSEEESLEMRKKEEACLSLFPK